MSALQMIALGKKLSNLYAALSLPVCRKYGLNQTCFDVLLYCANNPAHNTARDLCALRGIKSGIASVAVETLIERGFLSRENDAQDRRKHRLIPTPQAAPVIADGREMQQYFTQTLKHGITEEELQAFQSLADKLEDNLTKLEGKEDKSC